MTNPNFLDPEDPDAQDDESGFSWDSDGGDDDLGNYDEADNSRTGFEDE